MILETLTDNEHFKYKWNDISIELMSGDFGIDPAKLRDMVEYMILINLLESEDNYIFSPDLTERFSVLVAKRNKNQFSEESQKNISTAITYVSDNVNSDLNELSTTETMQKRIIDEFLPQKSPLNRVIDVGNPQSKVKESKEKKTKENNIPDVFSEFWEKYPGTKSAIQVEYEKFSKKNKPETLLLLLPGLEKELKHHEQLKSQKSFVPSWKNLTNWIKDRCWEQVWPEPQNPNNLAQKVEIEQKQANSEEPYFVKINRERLKK